jgi:hypothetical protein
MMSCYSVQSVQSVQQYKNTTAGVIDAVASSSTLRSSSNKHEKDTGEAVTVAAGPGAVLRNLCL